MAAEFEKIVVPADTLDLEQLRPDRRQYLLRSAPRRLEAPPRISLALGRWQRAPVQLVFGVNGNADSRT
jgi:hypothetical protein